MDSPDTTEAVAGAMYEYGKRHDMHRLKLSPQQDLCREAQAAIAADREALEEAGYAIVRRNEVPPWMEETEPLFERFSDEATTIQLDSYKTYRVVFPSTETTE